MRSLIAAVVVTVSSVASAQGSSEPLLKKKSVALPPAVALSRSRSSPAAPTLKWVEPERQVELMAHEKRIEMIRTLEQLIELERR